MLIGCVLFWVCSSWVGGIYGGIVVLILVVNLWKCGWFVVVILDMMKFVVVIGLLEWK